MILFAFEEELLEPAQVVYIDENGAVSLPFFIRNRLDLHFEDELEVDTDGQHIYMRRIPRSAGRRYLEMEGD